MGKLDNTLASVYSRDYSVTYGLKLQASRQMLTKSAAVTSVYPFKLSHVVDDELTMNQAKLGYLPAGLKLKSIGHRVISGIHRG